MMNIYDNRKVIKTVWGLYCRCICKDWCLQLCFLPNYDGFCICLFLNVYFH